MPVITVVLPVHNGADYLHAAVDSILRQSFTDLELLIIDDGSTDHTPQIIAGFDDARIRRVRHEKNRGLIAVLNEGLNLASSKYIARMDADDVCHPRRLELQYRFMQRHPDVGVVGTAVRVMDAHGRFGPVYRYPEQHGLIVWALPFLCPIAHPTVMLRRDLALAAGGYSASAPHAEDYDLWERLSERTQFANLPQPLLNLRKYAASITSRQASTHAKTSVEVSRRCISRRLGRPVSEAAALCLMRLSSCPAQQVPEAARVLLDLYEGSRPLSAAVRRDTAMRLAMLALRGARGWARFKLAGRATRIDPRAWPGLAWRAWVRITGCGARRVVG